jgi:hypothetical protein
MIIKAICEFFDRRPIQTIDKNVKFFRFSPNDGVGIFFSDQKGLAFEEFTDQYPRSEIPPLLQRVQKGAQAVRASGSSNAQIVYVRLIYFAFLDDGDILTVSFQKGYSGKTDDRDWAIAKANRLNSFRANPLKIIDFYTGDCEKMSRGLDQNFTHSSLVFFYVCNRHMAFTGDKFSCVAVPTNPDQHKNPFDIIYSTDNNFFALYNDFDHRMAGGRDFAYKFNLHMRTKGHPGDRPTLIPFVVDPEVKNEGPPR